MFLVLFLVCGGLGSSEELAAVLGEAFLEEFDEPCSLALPDLCLLLLCGDDRRGEGRCASPSASDWKLVRDVVLCPLPVPAASLYRSW